MRTATGRTTRGSSTLRALLLGAALAAATLVPSAVAAAEPPCERPASPDRWEPPCNPALAQSPWAASHRGSYAQASSPLPGPADAKATHVRHTDAIAVPIQIQFTEPYPGGGMAAWMSTVSSPEREAILKVDVASGRVIDEWSALRNEGRLPGRLASASGAYNLLDRDNHLIVGRAQALEVFGDAHPGELGSPIALLRRFAVPAGALCRPDDELVGITMTFDGHVVFATKYGVVGAVSRRPAEMDADHLRTYSINGARCADPSVPAEELEEVSNSIANDERGGIYVVTDHAQYRINWRGGELRRGWRSTYNAGGTGGGARIGSGSGSTPTVMGARGDDRFVVITDGQELMHLVLMWRGDIPKSWKGLPGRPRRIACEVPVTFGDPDATQSVSEQSVLVRGFASVVVNNALALDPVFGPLPPALRPFSVVTGQIPGNAPKGVERIDWSPKTRTCRTRWASPNVQIPNGIPTMSAASGLFYGIGMKDAVWGLQGLDFATGRSRLWVPAGPLPNENSFFAATEVGPGGAVWTGTFGGVTVFGP